MMLSVVIPAYNESKNFHRGVLDTVDSFLKKQKYGWEVILVNDGSTDNTLKLLKGFTKTHPGFRVLDIPHGGKVAAVSSGVFESYGEYVLFTDFDQSTPMNEVTKVMEEFKKGADIVIGERKSSAVNRSLFQTVRSKVFNSWVKLLLLPGISDSQCGFKAFRLDVGKKLFRQLKVTHHTQKGGYMGAFDAELLFLARIQGYKITPIPVSWQYFKSRRLSLTEPLKMARDVFLVKLQDLTGGYQKATEAKQSGLREHILPLLLFLLLIVPSFSDTIRVGFFPMHDDLQFTRQLVMDECFKDGQIPCRWSKHLGYGYGYPLFNYYPPLPYYLGQPFRWLGFQYVDVVKVLVVLNFIVTGLTMYLLAQSFWGRWGGLISAIAYTYAPYHAVNIYVRGAINEAWMLAWFPLVFWSIYKLITAPKFFYVTTLALSTSFLLLTHNPMTMIFAPLAITWCIFWLISTKNFKVVFKLLLSAIWAIGLASFFTLPILFESNYAHIETLTIGYFNYLAHFVDIGQLFISRYWGYGSSNLGPNDEMSFQIGHPHWILAIFSLITAYLLARKKPTFSLMILTILSLTFFYTFMMHVRSSFIWSSFKPLIYLQFPWRFLSIVIFGASFLAGSILLVFDRLKLRTIKLFTLLGLIVLTIILNKDYFKWREHWSYVTDGYRYTEKVWQLQITSGIFDYLPIWASFPPGGPPKADAEINEGEGKVTTFLKNSINQEYEVKATSESKLQINTFYFPGWKYFINSKEIDIVPHLDKELGRPVLKLPAGNHIVTAKFTDTPIRRVGNILSLLAFLVLLWLILYKYLLRRHDHNSDSFKN